MRKVEYNAQFCVVGGGLSGLCAAISAARHGIKTVLMQDRPVLGGNASSEIRMWVCGAQGYRATGIIEELELENFYQNPAHKFPIWDSVLYEKAILEPNIKLLLNCSCLDAEMDGNTIKSVTGWQSVSQTYYKINADYFADCSGDSILAPLTGADFTYGREAKAEFNETIPPDVADRKTMGMSCLMQLRETDHKTYFKAPSWAYKYEKPEDFPGRVPKNINDNFWWIETGGLKDCIYDTDECRDELLKICYGVWDYMKNYSDIDADNWELEWIGFLPGKRESNRYRGAYVISQNDVEAGGKFDDVVAFAGWKMDDHFPEGFYYKGELSTIFHPAPSPWGITYRSLYSRNINNLYFAGRNISVTHAALSSSRVMETCSLLGQAVGTAVSVVINENYTPQTVDIKKVQELLMQDDCFLPGLNRNVSELTKKAHTNAEIVRNGIERETQNCWIGNKGDYIEYSFDVPQTVQKIRIVFDSDLKRNYQNMPCNFKLNEPRFKLPETIIKKYLIILTDENGNESVIAVDENHQRLVWHNVGKKLIKVRLVPNETWGCKTFNVFSFELI